MLFDMEIEMRDARDSQRLRVYKAERRVHHLGKPLREVEDIQRFIQKQLKRKAITSRYPDATRPIAIHHGGGRRNACAYGGWKISIPLWARNELIVIHEVAHIVTNRHYGDKRSGVAGHGWQFCAVFLDLVRFIMGKEAHDALKASFKEHKVRFTAPRKKKWLTPEQKAALAERLAAARAAKPTS